jgi:hypothetical protein
MKTLPKAQQQKAKEYIFNTGRPLEQALYQYYFENGRAEVVLQALASFQNADGGFGRAMEPDMRAPESSALATSHALEALRELETPAEHPLVKNSIAYLVETFDAEKGVWRIIPETTDSHPHAPWWNQDKLEKTFDHFLANPRPELVGYLFTYESLVPANFKEQLLEDVLKHAETSKGEVSGDAILCYLRLHDTKNVPANARERLADTLRATIGITVETNPEKWPEYCLKPLQAINSPDSPFADILADALQQNLDYEIEHQCDDGSWAPHWSWFGQFPEDWKIAEQEWRGIIIVNTLRALNNFGRLQQ